MGGVGRAAVGISKLHEQQILSQATPRPLSLSPFGSGRLIGCAFALRNHINFWETNTSWLFALIPQDNPKRPLQCLNVDISRPLKALDFPQPRPPPRVLPPLHQAPRAPGVPARPLPANPAPRQAQVRLQPLIRWMQYKSESGLCCLLTSELGRDA